MVSTCSLRDFKLGPGSLRDRDLPYLVSAGSAVYLGLLGILDFILLSSASRRLCKACFPIPNSNKGSNKRKTTYKRLRRASRVVIIYLPQDDYILFHWIHHIPKLCVEGSCFRISPSTWSTVAWPDYLALLGQCYLIEVSMCTSEGRGVTYERERTRTRPSGLEDHNSGIMEGYNGPCRKSLALHIA